MCALLNVVIRVLKSFYSPTLLPGYKHIRTCTDWFYHRIPSTLLSLSFGLRPWDNSASSIRDKPLVGMF